MRNLSVCGCMTDMDVPGFPFSPGWARASEGLCFFPVLSDSSLWCLRIIFPGVWIFIKPINSHLPPKGSRLQTFYEICLRTTVLHLSLQLDALLSMQTHSEPPFLLHWKAWQPCLPVACCVCVCVCVTAIQAHLKASILSANRSVSSWWVPSGAFVAARASKSQGSTLGKICCPLSRCLRRCSHTTSDITR